MATKFQEGGQLEAQRNRLGPPKMYKVVLLNDPVLAAIPIQLEAKHNGFLRELNYVVNKFP